MFLNGTKIQNSSSLNVFEDDLSSDLLIDPTDSHDQFYRPYTNCYWVDNDNSTIILKKFKNIYTYVCKNNEDFITGSMEINRLGSQ